MDALKFHVSLVCLLVVPLRAAELEISLRHTFSGETLRLNSMGYSNSVGEKFSVTRLSYLLSGFSFERDDGSWIELTNQFAWIDLEKERRGVRLELPGGNYRRASFCIGLEAEANHANPARFAADHPLNPNLNELHWNWQGGYVFLALEGLWRSPAPTTIGGPLDGFSYHLARDTNRVRVELNTPLQLAHAGRLDVEFDIATLLNGPGGVSLATDGSSTHSRDGDPVAAALVMNSRRAFRVARVATKGKSRNSPALAPLDLPAKFTPYRFLFSDTFPIPALPHDNPLIEERIALGRALFNEPLLSRDGTVSCGSCHNPRAALSDSRRFSIGVSNRVGTRQSMPLFNLAWKNTFFWDGRAASLREQALMPIQDHAEMDESLSNVVAKLQGRAGSFLPAASAQRLSRRGEDTGPYPQLFATAFSSAYITSERIGLALEQFLLTLTSFDSKFDRSLCGEADLSELEKRGFELFMTEYDPRRGQFGADCFHCHGGPLFRSRSFANNGLDSIFVDAGRRKITGNDSDAGKFATPSLRNIWRTAPYMHDGRFTTLGQVVEHYSTGVKRSAMLDPNLAKHPDGGLHLEDKDKAALVAFLKTLTDEKFSDAGGELKTLRLP